MNNNPATSSYYLSQCLEKATYVSHELEDMLATYRGSDYQANQSLIRKIKDELRELKWLRREIERRLTLIKKVNPVSTKPKGGLSG